MLFILTYSTGPLSARQPLPAPDLDSQGDFGVLRSKSGGFVSSVLSMDPLDGTCSYYFKAALCWRGLLVSYEDFDKYSAGSHPQ